MGLHDQPALAENTQVTAHCRRRDTQRRRQLTSAPRPLAQEIDRPPPIWIGQRGKRTVDVDAGRLCQRVDLTLTPPAAAISSFDMARNSWAKLHEWPSRSSTRYVRWP